MRPSLDNSAEQDCCSDLDGSSGPASDDRERPGLVGWVSRALLVWPVRLYQMTLSRVLPPLCRFEPSCSQYAVEAVEVHGALRGGLLAVLRILRCNPFSEGGYDPVPPRVPGSGKERESTE